MNFWQCHFSNANGSAVKKGHRPIHGAFREIDQSRVESEAGDVRFGSKADICTAIGHVRFTPESGHCQATVGCLLCAKSGHQPTDSITGRQMSSDA
jgi:hypothetical protein